MRIAFDINQFEQALDRALSIPCTDAKHKMAMTLKLGPICAAILQSADKMPPPQSHDEGMQRVTMLLCTAFSIGFDTGRTYEDQEAKSRIELVQ